MTALRLLCTQTFEDTARILPHLCLVREFILSFESSTPSKLTMVVKARDLLFLGILVWMSEGLVAKHGPGIANKGVLLRLRGGGTKIKKKVQGKRPKRPVHDRRHPVDKYSYLMPQGPKVREVKYNAAQHMKLDALARNMSTKAFNSSSPGRQPWYWITEVLNIS